MKIFVHDAYENEKFQVAHDAYEKYQLTKKKNVRA